MSARHDPGLEVDAAGRVFAYVAGVRAEIVDEAGAEAATAMACAPASFPSPFADNVFVDCAWCGAPIQHRPTAPKRPPKICLGCLMQHASPAQES